MNAAIRTVTSINWLLGTLALGAAILIPTLRNTVLLSAEREQAKAMVKQIAGKQHDHYLLNGERYAPFTLDPKEAEPILKNLGLAAAGGDFVYDAGMNQGGELVIRAFTSEKAMTTGTAPPLFYRYTLPAGAEEGKGEWVELTKRTPGLHNLLAFLGIAL